MCIYTYLDLYLIVNPSKRRYLEATVGSTPHQIHVLRHLVVRELHLPR